MQKAAWLHMVLQVPAFLIRGFVYTPSCSMQCLRERQWFFALDGENLSALSARKPSNSSGISATLFTGARNGFFSIHQKHNFTNWSDSPQRLLKKQL